LLKKELLVGCENKVLTTGDAFQRPILKIHLRPSETGRTGGRA
jgi:hypothetical protein